MFTERFIDTGEVRVRLGVGPDDGPPLLFLHGISRVGRDFAPLFPAFWGWWQVLALDQRGHGGSGRCPGRYRVADYVRDAVAVVRAVNEPVVLYGHSLGALTAAGVAAAEPERVRGVVLEDPPGSSFLARLRSSPYFAQFQAVQRLAGQNRPVSELARELAAVPLPQPNGTTARLGDYRDITALRFAARCLPDLDPAVFDSLLDGSWLDGYDEESVWQAIRCPVLLLRGEPARGGMLPAADAERMTGRIADCFRVEVAGAGHLIHWLATEECVRLTLGFVESL